MIGVSASVNLPLHHKVQKFSSGTGSPGWSRKKGHKTVVVVWCGYLNKANNTAAAGSNKTDWNVIKRITVLHVTHLQLRSSSVFKSRYNA